MYEYSALAVRVIDGDTAELLIDLGFRIGWRIHSRLAHINAPELSDPDPVIRQKAVDAKNFLTNAIEGKTVRIISRSLDKYGRPIVEVFAGSDLVSINDQMLAAGLAIRFM